MQANHKLPIVLLVGAAVGALAAHGLHAQAKPTAYVIIENDATNQDGYAKEFAPLALKAFLDGGAKYLARGGKTTVFDGEPPKNRVSVVAFENIDKAQAAISSPAYKEARKVGEKYAKFRIFAVEGVSQ